jgi:outer membrane protein assembly factor BamA
MISAHVYAALLFHVDTLLRQTLEMLTTRNSCARPMTILGAMGGRLEASLVAFVNGSLRWLGGCAAASCLCLPALAQETSAEKPLPTFEELEAEGAVIGDVRIINGNIFDLENPKEDNLLFRLANKLHIRTRPDVIERDLLFRSGDRVSVQKVQESERLLRSNRFLYSVDIRVASYFEGVADVEVETRDTWTIEPGVRFSRAGGVNSTGLTLKEGNLLGTGTSIAFAESSDVDRRGHEFSFAQDHLFGGWTGIDLTLAHYDDGNRESFRFGQPFYSLDSRWSAGTSALHDDRIDSIYRAGVIAEQYRHREETGEVHAGWSKGLIDGYTRRYSVGLNYQDDRYTADPALPSPAIVPEDQRLIGPYLRYDVIQDNFEKVVNRDKIARPEFFELGFNSSIQIGRALTFLGSSRELWTYTASVSDGVHTARGNDLLGSISVSGQYGDGHGQRELLSVSSRYFVPHAKRALFYVAASADMVRNPLVSDLLLLGGDNGLRGYPLRYQSGEQRALFTIEERVYTDWFPLRLFRVGGAVFYDIGRAWGGPFENTVNPGWLSDVGFGLRILNDRASFGNVLHADVAFPLNTDPTIRSVQFLVKSYANF